MTRSQAIKFFGGKAEIARALDISYAAVQQWGEEIPLLRQHQLEKISNGVLQVSVARPVEATNRSVA